MNQILDYNPNKTSKKGGSSGSDKIVRVFAILLAVFAICLLGVGGYSLLKNKKTEIDINNNNATKAVVTVIKNEESLTIKVIHDKALDKLAYNWDSNKETTISCNKQTEFETEINSIAGEHVLTIMVTDVNGVETTYTDTFTFENGEDKEKPVITTEVKEDKYVVVTVTDETELDFVTYRWNDQEELRVEAEDGEKTLSFQIDILEGQNSLLIIAVDKNENSASEEKEYLGLLDPVIRYTVSSDKNHVTVNISHQNGLKEVKIYINDQEYNVDIGTDNPKDVELGFDIQGENNKIKTEATSVDNTIGTAETEIVNETETVDNIEIVAEQDEGNKKVLNINIKSPDGIQTLSLNINDVEYPIDMGESLPEDRKDISFQLELQQGNNKIIFNITKPNGEEKHETKEIYYE